MRVSNTPFNSPLNSGHSRIETRTRTEIGGGPIKTSGGGMKIDCKDMSQKNIDQYKINISLTFSVIDDIREFTTVTFRFSSDGSVAVGNL